MLNCRASRLRDIVPISGMFRGKSTTGSPTRSRRLSGEPPAACPGRELRHRPGYRAACCGEDADSMAEDLEIQAQKGLDFYISYAGRDRVWAEWVGWQLQGAGFTFELDLWHWLPGDNVIL